MAQAPLSPATDQEESGVEAARTFILCNPEFVLGDAELMRALLSADISLRRSTRWSSSTASDTTVRRSRHFGGKSLPAFSLASRKRR